MGRMQEDLSALVDKHHNVPVVDDAPVSVPAVVTRARSMPMKEMGSDAVMDDLTKQMQQCFYPLLPQKETMTNRSLASFV